MHSAEPRPAVAAQHGRHVRIARFVASVRTATWRPLIGRSVASCSVVRPGPSPREIQALKRRCVITAGACPNAAPACASSAAPPAAGHTVLQQSPARQRVFLAHSSPDRALFVVEDILRRGSIAVAATVALRPECRLPQSALRSARTRNKRRRDCIAAPICDFRETGIALSRTPFSLSLGQNFTRSRRPERSHPCRSGDNRHAVHELADRPLPSSPAAAAPKRQRSMRFHELSDVSLFSNRRTACSSRARAEATPPAPCACRPGIRPCASRRPYRLHRHDEAAFVVSKTALP
jgi:hypothetical protein